MSDNTWDGTTGNWSDGSKWSLGHEPDATENAIFPNGTYTITTDAAAGTRQCLSLAFGAGAGVITWAFNQHLNLYGDLTLLAGMAFTATAGKVIYTKATTGTQTITSNGVVWPGASLYREAATGGTTLLADDLISVTNNSVIYHYSGTFDTQNHNVQVGQFDCRGNTARTVTLGSSTIAVFYGAIYISGTNLSVTANTATLRVFGTSGVILDGGGNTFEAAVVDLPAGASSASISGAITVVNCTVTGSANKGSNVSLSANITATNFTATGNSATNRLLIQSNTLGTPRTINAATVSHGNVDYMDIAGSGAGWAAPTETGTIGDALGNSGITFTAAADQYWYTTTGGAKTTSTAGNWFLGSGGTGGAGRVPLPQDNRRFDANSIGAAGTVITDDMPRMGKNIDWTGVTNNPTWAPDGSSGQWYGSLTLASGMTFSPIGQLYTRARGTATLTTNGKSMATSINVMYGCTLSLQDAFAGGYNVTVSSGATLTTNDYSLTVPGQLSNSGTVNLGASTATFTGSGITYSGTGTMNYGTSTMKLTDASATTKTFNNSGGSRTFGNLWLAGSGSGAYNFVGNCTFADLKISDGAKTIKFTASTNTTVASMTGFEDTAATFDTVSGAGTFTITKSGGGVVKMRGANVTRSTASPAATFYAGATGVDGGGNTNWTFNNAPATASASITTDDVALVASGTAGIVGTAVVSLDDATQAAAATVAIVAAAAITQDDAQHTAAGTTAIAGAAAITQDDATPAAAGTVAIAGAAAITQDDATQAGSGDVWTVLSDPRYVANHPPRKFTLS